MGVNAVVIAENSLGISLKDFMKGLREDPWGIHASDKLDEGWGAFDWNGKRYLSWLYAPRVRYLELYATEMNAPDIDTSVQLTFLKVMLAVERLAGGPVYVGNDAVHRHLPEEVNAHEEACFLPPLLDNLIPQWREVGKTQVQRPCLVF